MKKTFLFLFTAILLNLLTANAQNSKQDFFSSKKRTRKPNSSVSLRFEEQVTDGRLNRNNLPFYLNSIPIKDSNNSFLVATDHHSTPYYIKKKVTGFKNKRTVPLNSTQNCRNEAEAFLRQIRKTLKISSTDIFEIQTKNNDPKHLRFIQKLNGIPVLGADGIIHLEENGGHFFHGRIENIEDGFNTIPKISSSDAIKSSLSDLQKSKTLKTLNEQEQKMLEYSGPSAALVIFPRKDLITTYELAWEISIRPNIIDHFHYYVSAVSGKIISKENHTCTAVHATGNAPDLNGVNQVVTNYQSGNTYYLIDITNPMFSADKSVLPDQPVGAIWTMSAENTDLTSIAQITSTSPTAWSPTAVSAHSNAKKCYQYYLNTFNRNSLNGQGGNIISVINVTEDGKSMENAYWNGKLMAYGNGGTYFKPLAASLDVAAHEMTHGVIQNTCNLNYSGQSGAINESLADIFGTLVDRDDWQVGEGIVKNLSLFPTGALRDLSNPHNGGNSKTDYSWQPAHMNEYITTTQDNGGVHINSGIPNHAFYLFATQVSKEKAEKVYYLAMTKYLFASARFIDLRIAIVSAATELYGENSNEVAQAKTAFDQVGILDGQGTNSQADLPENPGNEFLLITHLDKDGNNLETIKTATSEVIPLTNTKVARRPTISDNGSVMYFVTKEGAIRQFYTSSKNESLFDNSRNWVNVAVSRDGSKIAAVTDDEDSSIYVRKTVAGAPWMRFILYNPTFTPDSTEIRSNGPKYADALEWDYSGEKIMYDCYNLIKGETDSVVFWDVNFIKVWDNQSNAFSDGTVTKLYANLPEGISIGNATFSKKSPYIIAFDIIDEFSGYVDMVSTNIETSDGNFILNSNYGNGMLCFPTFDKTDGSLGYTRFNTSYTDTIFGSVDLSIDKISATKYYYYPSLTGKYFSYYADGDRVLGNKDQISNGDIKIYPNPFENNITIDLNWAGSTEITLFNALGQILVNETVNLNGFYSHQLSLPDIKSGTYIIKIKTKNGIFTSRLIRY